MSEGEKANGVNISGELTIHQEDSDTLAVNFNFDIQIDIEKLMLSAFPHLEGQYAEFDTLTPHLFPIVVGALIDARVTDMVAALMVEGKEARSLLGADGLGFKDRVRLAVALGLLPDSLSKPLYNVGYIRNHFAHRATASLLDDEIRGYCTDLVKELARFFLTGSSLVENDQELSSMIVDAKKAYEADRESIAREALKSSWLFFMVLTDATIARTQRLAYVDPEPKEVSPDS